MLWISSQSFAQNARSSLVTTDLGSSLNHSRNDPSNGGDTNKKTLYYTPWNGRFFMRYKGRLLVFRREHRAGEFNSREEVSISCFSRSPFPEYSSAAIQKLEDDVVEEIVARRKSKANRNSTAKALDYISRYISRYFGI
jgi:hypothetical protein